MALSDEKYIRVTTFKKDGTAVSTPTWVVELDDGKIGFYTSSTSGKAKRLRNDPKVVVQPSDSRGRAKPDASPLEGTAVVVTGSERDAIYEKVLPVGFMTKVTRLLAKVGGVVKRKKQPYADCGGDHDHPVIGPDRLVAPRAFPATALYRRLATSLESDGAAVMGRRPILPRHRYAGAVGSAQQGVAQDLGQPRGDLVGRPAAVGQEPAGFVRVQRPQDVGGALDIEVLAQPARGVPVPDQRALPVRRSWWIVSTNDGSVASVSREPMITRTSGSVRARWSGRAGRRRRPPRRPSRLEHGECLRALRERHVVVVAGERDVVHRLQESGLAAKGLVDRLLRDRRLVGHQPDGGAGEPPIEE